MGGNGLAMDGGAVTFVVEPIVVRKLLVKLLHVFVSGYFGKNAGGGNGVTQLISFDNGLEFDVITKFILRGAIAIYKSVFNRIEVLESLYKGFVDGT